MSTSAVGFRSATARRDSNARATLRSTTTTVSTRGGPAPRNLDRFVVTLDDSGQLIIDTGQVIQTSRSSQKTATYPQGPSCI